MLAAQPRLYAHGTLTAAVAKGDGASAGKAFGARSGQLWMRGAPKRATREQLWWSEDANMVRVREEQRREGGPL